MKEYLSLTEAQAHLGIKSRKTILKFIKRGDLQAFKMGGTRWRIASVDLRRFLTAQQFSNLATEVTQVQ